MKYAMIPICTYVDDNGRVISRRALVEYKKTKRLSVITIYKGTRLVEVDDYFKNKASSHTYTFTDEGFTLVDCKYPAAKLEYAKAGVLNKFRPYHTMGIKKIDKQVRFRAKNDDAAIKIFKEREELK